MAPPRDALGAGAGAGAATQQHDDDDLLAATTPTKQHGEVAAARAALKDYARPGDVRGRWVTLAAIERATGVATKSLRKRVGRLKQDDRGAIWRPTVDELPALHDAGALPTSAKQGILVRSDFATALCPELLQAERTPATKKKTKRGRHDDDSSDGGGGGVAQQKRSCSLGLAAYEKLQNFDLDVQLDDDDGGAFLDDENDDGGGGAGASHTTATTAIAKLVGTSPSPPPAKAVAVPALTAAQLATLAGMAGGAAGGGGEMRVVVEPEPAGAAPPSAGVLRRRGKAVEVPEGATDDQRFMLEVAQAYASARVAKNKAHQWAKVGAQVILGVKNIRRKGSFETVCRNDHLTGTKLFVQVAVASSCVTGLKQTIAPAPMDVWRAAAKSLSL